MVELSSSRPSHNEEVPVLAMPCCDELACVFQVIRLDPAGPIRDHETADDFKYGPSSDSHHQSPRSSFTCDSFSNALLDRSTNVVLILSFFSVVSRGPFSRLFSYFVLPASKKSLPWFSLKSAEIQCRSLTCSALLGFPPLPQRKIR